MSGLVKGVKKVFKAIGNAVKKIVKSPIFKALLIAAAVIFTGGAAAGAFGAMGAASTASLGGMLTAAAEGGMAAIGSVASSVAGIFGSGAAVGAGEGAMAAAATEAAAPGAAAWAAPAADTAGLFGGSEAAAGAGAGAAEAAGAMPAAATGGVAPEIASNALATNGASLSPELGSLAGNGNTSLANMASQGSSPSSGGWMQNVGTSGAKAADITGGMLQSPGVSGAAQSLSPSNPLSSLWDWIKPETEASKIMWGSAISGLGQGIMSGRNAEAERNFRQQMSAVPDMSGSFQLKPGFNWSLAGAK